MILRKGYIVCQSDSDLELRKTVEEFLELADMSKKYASQYINSGKDIMDLKEGMRLKSQNNFLYNISLGKWFDCMSLKRKIADTNSTREAVERFIAHIERTKSEYESMSSRDEDTERAELFKNVFVNYVGMYIEYLEKQVNLAKQYIIKIKSIEKVTDSDRKALEELVTQIVKNDKRMRMLYEEIKEVWLKIPEELMEEMVDNAEEEKIKENTEKYNSDNKDSKE